MDHGIFKAQRGTLIGSTTPVILPRKSKDYAIMPDTMHALIHELEKLSPAIASFNLVQTVPDIALADDLRGFLHSGKDLKRCAAAIEILMKRGLTSQQARESVSKLLEETQFYGQFFELGTYEWLDSHGIQYKAQVPLTNVDVLNTNGCQVDGHFSAIDAYFDIKGFGFQAHIAEKFRKELQAELPKLMVSIEGPLDVAVKDIVAAAFPKVASLAISLANGGVDRIPELGWIIRADPPGITTATYTVNAYEVAENNRYYPFKTARQYTRDKPFVLIFGYNRRFNGLLAQNAFGTSDITLRALARRAFIQLSTDQQPASNYDRKVPAGVSVAQASGLLSAIVFVNLDADDAHLFINPRATNPIHEHDIQALVDFGPTPFNVDDFAHDNY